MRRIENINSKWLFLKGDTKNHKIPTKADKNFQEVNLPHTWNALDGQDGGFDYYRGVCWYLKEVNVKLEDDEEAYLEFPAVSMTADIYVNGKHAEHHEGGFSTFRVNVTKYIENDKIKVAVCADNSESNKVYPQTADFTFFGGLYRGVNLVIVNKSHFNLDYFGSSGISITPKLNDNGSAEVVIKSYITNSDNCKVKYEVAGKTANGETATIHLENPHLWNGVKDPYLYTLTATLEKNGKAVDEITAHFGVRSFKVDANKGFILNGKPYPLHGVSRHQDRLDKGWAISKEDHEEDMKLIAEIGANTIRLAHYQHSQYFYDLCDKYGMIVWAEIPFISAFMSGNDAKQNTFVQMRELVLQNFNHPSIVCWGIANEITIGGEDPRLLENLVELNDLCHVLDNSRPTTMAQLSMLPMDSELNKITDIISYNHYFGWYMGNIEDNAKWIDEFHKLNPNICLGISEYGCEGILKYHTDEPKVQDYSEEYQSYYHEQMLETFAERPFLWSTYVWNMFDFASDMRDEGGVKGRNNKGLVTFDRKTKKDSFFIYKAYWSDEKFVHLCSKRYVNRANDKTDIKVYSNCDEITLFVNGNGIETLPCDKKVTFKGVKLKEGKNEIKVIADKYKDEMVIYRVDAPDESYVLKKEDKGNSGSNWFDKIETTSTDLVFPDGYFSIKDKMGDIMKNPKGNELVTKMIESITSKMNLNISKGMMAMVKGMTLEKIFDMSGDKIPNKVKLWVNSELTKIKK